MENMCALVKFFLQFTNLYPATCTSQAPLKLELSTCLQQCLDSGSCLSVFYDKSKKQCLHIEGLLSASDSSLVAKQGMLYYGQNRAPLETGCPVTQGYNLRSGLCLKLAHITETWPAANLSCENDGASLLKIESKEKNDALKLMLGTQYQWAGGNDLVTEGTYVWTDGTPIQGFTNWIGAEPDGGTNQNCMTIHSYGWHNGGCNGSRQYMCEKNINATRNISA